MEKRKRGRPPKMVQLALPNMQIEEKQENIKMASTDVNSVEYHLENNINVKLMTRKLSKTGGYTVDGGVPVIEAENDLSKFVDAGYKISYVMMIEQDPQVIHLLYVLSKQ